MIERIVYHAPNDNENHNQEKLGQNLYGINLYGYIVMVDTWELVEHLPRRKVMRYCSRKRIELPNDPNSLTVG